MTEMSQGNISRRASGVVMVLLQQLEASLRDGLAALLRRDLNGIKRSTEEQKALFQALAELPGGFASLAFGDDAEQTSQFQEAEIRILRMGQLQAKLLARAQRALIVSANLVAGAGSSYGPTRVHSSPRVRCFSDAGER